MATMSLTHAATRMMQAATGDTLLSARRMLLELGIDTIPTLGADTTPDGGDGAPASVESLGRFHVQRELGRGGMGRVLSCHDPELLRNVAVKTLLDPSQIDEHALARFVAEAQITAQLDHPNIVPVHELGVTTDGLMYFVMKRVEGGTLRDVLVGLAAGEPTATAMWTRFRLLMAFVLVCNAVAYAHDRGVLHRDLKPENILLGPFGQIFVMDWGVARLMRGGPERVRVEDRGDIAVSRTMDGTTIGTPGYMSPEQVRGHLDQMDGRSDVWALGAILYEILTGIPAYDAKDPFARLVRTVTESPVDPRLRAPSRNIPAPLAEACLRAMAMEPADRFPSAVDLAFAVGGYMEGARDEADRCDEGRVGA